jgi:3-hydroxybutyryl-CoA dehydrogenase
MGAAFAAVFSVAGYRTSLVEIDEAVIATGLERAEEIAVSWRGPDAASLVRDHLGAFSDLALGVADAELVIEAATEDLGLKQALFGRLDDLCSPTAVLCSNTSALPISQVMAQVERQDRVLGTHWFNPPHLVPAVEVIRGPATSDKTIRRVFETLRELGKEPVEVTDSPGFLANRLQMALAKEAMLCLEEGVASAEDIDRLFSSSIGFRLAAVGPLGIADFAGLDVYLEVFETLAGGVSDRFSPPALLRELVGRGELGAKTGSGFLRYDDGRAGLVAQRDQRLLELSRLKASDRWDGDGTPAGSRSPVRSLLLDERDSVAVVLQDVQSGDAVEIPGNGTVTATSDIAAGHKLCVRELSEGDVVLKYGEPIGVASQRIGVGEHVHVHNLASNRAGGSSDG